MNKYTINKAFEKHFSYPVWKIEVDCLHNRFVVEYRDPTHTIPSFSVITFEGDTVLENYTISEKEWTIEAIQGDFLIFKRFGTSSPIQAGVQVLHIPSQSVVSYYQQYILKEVYNGILKVAHRSIPSGLEYYMDLESGDVGTKTPVSLLLPYNSITYPIPYQGHLPDFIKDLAPDDQIWLQPYQNIFIWSYHKKHNNNFDLYLCLSTKNEILDHKIILKGLDRLIPQPYFQVKGHIFFLSNTKQEIATYLV